MKKIDIFMKDNFYAKKLNIALNNMFNDINSNIITSVKERKKDSILLVDHKGFEADNMIILDERRKYQSIDFIYKLICEKYQIIDANKLKQEIICFANLSENKSINNVATEISRKLGERYETLLINFNNFSKYVENDSDISLDSLLFIKDKNADIAVNKHEGLNYLSSSNIPLETEKLENIQIILDTLKYQKYKKIIIDLSFSISSKCLEILNNSDTIIFFHNIQSKSNFINSTKSFIKNHTNHKYREIHISKSHEKYNILIENSNFTVENIQELVEIYDKNRRN